MYCSLQRVLECQRAANLTLLLNEPLAQVHCCIPGIRPGGKSEFINCREAHPQRRETNGDMATSDARLRALLADGMDATVLPASALALAAECVYYDRESFDLFPSAPIGTCTVMITRLALMCRISIHSLQTRIRV